MEAEVNKRPRRDWTALEVKKLRYYSQLKSPISEIGKALQRSENALRQKAHELGIALGQRQKRSMNRSAGPVGDRAGPVDRFR
jgi:hypothetical protein